jgi:hypothetical protein
MRLATVYLEWDDLEHAEGLLQRALELTEALHTHAYARVYVALARLCRARGDLDGADAALDATPCCARDGTKCAALIAAEHARLTSRRPGQCGGDGLTLDRSTCTFEREGGPGACARRACARSCR